MRGSWRPNRTATLTNHSYGHNSVSFPFSWAAQPGDWGPSLSGTASSLQLVWSPTAQSEVLRAPSAGCWFSLPHLIANWLNFLWTELYNSSTPTFFSWASQIALIQPVHGKVIFWYSSTGYICYLHRCISYFDSLAGVNMQQSAEHDGGDCGNICSLGGWTGDSSIESWSGPCLVET